MSSRSILALLLALAAVGVLAMLLGRRGGGGGAVQPVDPASAAAARVERSSVMTAQVERAPVAPAPSPELSSAAPAPSSEPSLEVVVLRADTRGPVEGCEVSICDLDRFFEEVRERALTDRPARRRLLLELAVTERTAADGRVRLPLLGERRTIEATRADGLWGRAASIGAPVGPVEVLVAEDRTLEVLVRDVEGRPVAGVPVVLCGDPPRSPGHTERSTQGGSATFAHAQELVTADASWHLGFGFPVCAPRLHVIPAAALPAAPVELVLPPTGRLELALVDEEGRPVPGGLVAAELLAFMSSARTIELTCMGSSRELAFDVEGRAALEHVGLGLPLRLALRASDARPPLELDLDGPRQAGETVARQIVWRSERELPAITGRFVRDDGSPWPAAKLEVRAVLFPYVAGPVSWDELEVAEGGRFRLVPRAPFPPGGARVLHVRCLAPEELAGVEGRLDLSWTLPPGETELGDVLLGHGVLLAAGEVVDEDGAPLPGARLELCQRVQLGERDAWPRYECAGGRDVAADGDFALRAIPGLEPPRSDLRLSARIEGHVPAEIEITAGQSGLRVVLPRGGALEGSVRLAPGQDASELLVVLKGERTGHPLSVRADGHFQADGLPPGMLRLSASLRDATEAEREASRVVVEDLRIEAGATNRDPRIQGIELADDAHRLTLELLDAAGGPIEGATVATSEGREARSDRRGLTQLRARELPIDLTVRAFGHRTLALESVSEDRRVVLDEALWIRLVTDTPAVGREPDYRLCFRIRPLDERGQRGPVLDLPPARTCFDAAGEALLPMPAPGEYSVEPTVSVQVAPGAGSSAMLPESALRRITVRDVPEVQFLRIDIPQELVDAALRRE